jgi:hypothetical protein
MTTYGNTTVTTDNGHDNVLGQGEVADDLSNEGRGTDNVESGNTEKATGRCRFLSNIFSRYKAYRLGSKTPCFLKTSATMGTVELTGLEMTRTKALGAVVAISVARPLTMPALI